MKWAPLQIIWYVFVVALHHSGSGLAVAQTALDSRLCLWSEIELPQVSQPVNYALTRSGMLFVADERHVFAQTPWGWEIILTAPSDAGAIQTIGTVAAAGDDALIVVADFASWRISWHRYDQPGYEWAPFRLVFEAQPLELGSCSSPGAIRRSDDKALVRGYLLSMNGSLCPIFMRDQLVVGNPISIEQATSSPVWSQGAHGWSYAWAHGDPTLYILDPSGLVVETRDLYTLLDPEGFKRSFSKIMTVATEPNRRLLFVGTERGVAVADLEYGTGKPSSPFYRIESLGMATLIHLGMALGRLVGVTDRADIVEVEDLKGPLIWERPSEPVAQDARTFAAKTRFERARGLLHPEAVVEVIQPADDVIWAGGLGRGLWEWSPGGWRLLTDDQLTLFGELAITNWRQSAAGPLIAPDVAGKRLFLCRPREDFWTVQQTDSPAPIRHLVPDPSGGGVWAITESQIEPEVGGHIQFLTPHGHLPRLHLIGGKPIRFTRLSYAHLSSHKHFWPQSRHGGLLLPTGSVFLHGDAGRWRLFDPQLPEGQSLRALTPGAESSDTAWLGILTRGGHEDRAVRIDLSEDSTQIDIETLQAVCAPTGAAVLVPDEDGHVWFACPREKAWLLSRLHAIVSEPDRMMVLKTLPEPPRQLLKGQFAGFVLTDHGIASAGGVGRSRFAEGFDPNESPLIAQIIEERSIEPGLPWRRLLIDTPDLWNSHTRFRALHPGFARHGFKLPDRFTILTEVVSEAMHQAAPGPGYVLDLTGEPAVTPIDGPSGQADQPLLHLEFPGIVGTGVLIWGNVDGQRDQATGIEHFTSELGGPVLTSVQQIRGMSSLSAAVSYNATEFAGDEVPISQDFLAVTDGNRVAIRQFPDALGPSDTQHIVPVSLRIEHTDGAATLYDLRQPLPANGIAGTAIRGVLQIQHGYETWWNTAFKRVTIQTREDGDWYPVDAQGRYSFQLNPSATYALSLQPTDWQGFSFGPLRSLPLRIQAAPPLPVPWWAYVAVAAVVIMSLLMISVRTRRWVLIRLGRRWYFELGTCHYRVEIATNPLQQVSLSLRDIATSNFPSITTAFPPREGGLGTFHELFEPGTLVRVEVSGAELFTYPWSHGLGHGWSKGQDAVIAGQIVTLPPDMQQWSTPSAAEKMRFHAVGYTPSAEAEPKRYLAGIERELQELTKRFQDWRADTDASYPGDVDSLRQALIKADVVHVSSHADLTGVELQDGRMSIRDLDDDLIRTLRCKLLVLSACEIGQITDPETSFVFHLVRSGVNVIGATRAVDRTLCRAFFEELYESLFHSPRAQGVVLADAIRQAAKRCEMRFQDNPYDWRSDLDAFVFYGDPSLHLVFGRPQRSGNNDRA